MLLDIKSIAENVLLEREDTKEYKLLFVLTPRIQLEQEYYNREFLDDYYGVKYVTYAAKSASEIASIDISDRRADFVAPWITNLGYDFMKLLEMNYQIKAITPEGYYCMWRYIASSEDMRTVAGVKQYMDDCKDSGITKEWLQVCLPKVTVPDIYDIKAWKPNMKKSRYYLYHSGIENAENYQPICILDKYHKEGTEVFTIAYDGMKLVTFHPKDFTIERQKAIQLAEKDFHEILLEKLKDGFHIDYMELSAHTMLWTALPKSCPYLTKEIDYYLDYCRLQGNHVKELQNYSGEDVVDIMRFYSNSKQKQEER